MGGGITSPLAIASAFLASTSAFEGRPRFLGWWLDASGENACGEPFEEGFGCRVRVVVITSPPDCRRFGLGAEGVNSKCSGADLRL